MKTFHLLLMSDDFTEGRRIASIESRSLADIPKLSELQALAESMETPADPLRRGPKGRQVICLMTYPLHDEWLAGTCEDAKNRSKLSTLPNRCEPGQIFPNAKAASQWLGFPNNEISYLLAKIAHEKDPTERKIYVRGVDLIYVDDAISGGGN